MTSDFSNRLMASGGGNISYNLGNYKGMTMKFSRDLDIHKKAQNIEKLVHELVSKYCKHLLF